MRESDESHQLVSIVSELRLSNLTGRLTALSIAVCLVAVLCYSVWTLDRGFELTDESYYVLLGMHPKAVRFYVSGQHWILSWLWQLSPRLEAYRAVGLAILIASAAMLAGGIIAVAGRLGMLRNGWASKIAVIGASVLCALLYATTINLSPSYNLLAAAGAYSAFGLVLMGCSATRQLIAHFAFGFAGIALAVEVVCKASAGVATLVLVAIWIVLFGGNRHRKLAGGGALVLGFAFMITIALITNTDFHAALAGLTDGTKLFRMVQIEPVHTRLLRYTGDLLNFTAIALVTFGVPLLLLVLFQRSGRAAFAVAALVVFSVILLSVAPHSAEPASTNWGAFLLGGAGHFVSQMTVLFALTLAALIMAVPLWRMGLDEAGLVIGLVVLPYTVAVGSGNALSTQVVVSLASWGGLVTLLAFTPFSRTVHQVIAVLLAVITASHIISSNFAPYNMMSPLSAQSESAELPGLGQLELDPETAAFARDIADAAAKCAIIPGSPILGLYNIPGVALLLKAVPLSTPWLNNKQQADFVLNNVPARSLEGLVIALNRVHGRVVPPMPERFATFPEGFTACGSGVYPFNHQIIEIWRTKL